MRFDHSLVFECCDHLVRMCRWMAGQDGDNLWDDVMRQGKRIVMLLLYVSIRHHWTVGLCYRQSCAGWLSLEALWLNCSTHIQLIWKGVCCFEHNCETCMEQFSVVISVQNIALKNILLKLNRILNIELFSGVPLSHDKSRRSFSVFSSQKVLVMRMILCWALWCSK